MYFKHKEDLKKHTVKHLLTGTFWDQNKVLPL